jgi:Bacterial Ig domain
MTIIQPAQNQAIPPGTDVLLYGAAADSDFETKRPPRVEEVTYQVDGGPPQPLAYTDTVYYWSTHVIYRQPIGILPGGNHTITVTAQFSLDTVTDSVTVQVGVPLVSLFTGTASFRTSYSGASGPFTFPVTVGLTFSPDGHIVAITSFPPLSTPPISLPFPPFPPGTTDIVTVSLLDGGTGGFDPASGNMAVPVTLHFHHSYSLLSDSDLHLVLSTGAEQSPHGVFNDQGSPMNMKDGAITVVGDGTFVGGILGGYDASLVLAGVVSPVP